MRLKRVVFVGIHNKPGFTPLDSRTRSGKIIDRVTDNVLAFCEKTNLFPINYLPHGEERERLIDQFHVEDGVFYVALGRVVTDCLERVLPHSQIIPVYHPGHALRRNSINQYVQGTVDLIHGRLYPEN